MSEEKTLESFDGFMGGRVYDLLAALTGFGPGLYRDAAHALPLAPGMRVLDLGCGTGALSLAVAERIGPDGALVGVDLSAKQLTRFTQRAQRLATPVTLHQGSMDELPFEEGSYDAVVSSLAIHGAPPVVRRRTIRQVARVLSPRGFFGLIDWSRPRLGLTGLLWLPTLLNKDSADNWNNRYPDLCARHGLVLSTDIYLSSLVRCQVFRKRTWVQAHVCDSDRHCV